MHDEISLTHFWLASKSKNMCTLIVLLLSKYKRIDRYTVWGSYKSVLI